jgi:hypothetical protein
MIESQVVLVLVQLTTLLYNTYSASAERELFDHGSGKAAKRDTSALFW